MINDYVEGKNRLTYLSGDYQLAALLFLPPGFNASQSYPAITITPPVTGVKEQTAGIYAAALAQKGFVTITFDQRGWGESEGPRYRANPYEFIEDIRSAVSLLRSLSFVDRDLIFGMGICMGSGFAAEAMAYDARVKALAVVSACVDAADLAFNAMGASGLRQMLSSTAPARDSLYQQNETVLIKPVPETEEEVANTQDPVAVGMREYYIPGMPGEHPNWNNRISPISYEAVMSYSIFNHVRMFDAIPSFHAYGSVAITRPGAERFYNEVKGTKQRLIIEGASHFDMYWRQDCVEPTVDAIAEFYLSL